jgi:competence protein ComEC
MAQRPLLPLLFALAGGIAFGSHFSIPDLPVFLVLCTALVIMIISAVVKQHKLLAGTILVALFAVGVLHINLYLYAEPGENHVSRFADGEPLSVQGLISENPRVRPDGTDLTVSAYHIFRNGCTVPVQGKILLSLKGSNRALAYGNIIRAKTRLRKPRNFQNPGGFDYVRYLRYRQILARGFVDTPLKIELIREHEGNPLKARLERFRSSLGDLIRNAQPGDDGTILQALLLGEKGEIPQRIIENFQKAGVAHVLAISGLHVGIIAFLSAFFIRKILSAFTSLLLRFNVNIMSALISFVPILFYAFIAGFGISTVRATIMILTFLVAISLGRKGDLLTTLGLAAFIILVFSPVSLFDVSFQLSFSAVTAILIITPRVVPLFHRREEIAGKTKPPALQKIWHTAVVFIVVSLAATIGTFPLTALYFNRISAVTIASNVIVIPIIGFIVLPLGILSIAVAPVATSLSVSLIKSISFFVHICTICIDYLASLPYSSFMVTTPTHFEIIAFYGCIILGALAVDTMRTPPLNNHGGTSKLKRSLIGGSLVCLILFFICDAIYVTVGIPERGVIRATFLDVGKGNSAFITYPRGTTMLIDGGGFYYSNFDVGKYIVAPFLWHERIKKIDIVVLTHPHQDHLNGLLYVMSHFDVKEVWTNGETAPIESYYLFRKIIHDNNIPYRVVSAMTPSMNIDGAAVSILSPPKGITEEDMALAGHDTNDSALVMKISLGSRSLFLASDILPPAEMRIALSGAAARSSVLLVPHHGSAASSTFPFISAVNPDYAVISCGAGAVHRHAYREVAGRYKAAGAKIYSTGVSGAVTVKTDGKELTVSCQSPAPDAPD